MNIFEESIEEISKAVPKAEKTYMGEDGFLHCSVCHRAVQTEVEALGRKKIVACICDCEVKRREAFKERERKEECERKRRVCFAETNMASWTFENDDRRNAKISDAMIRYAQQFAEFKKQGQGLLLYGPVGTGKSYYAACIANRLIDEGRDVLMTNFARLTNQIQATFEDKQEIIDSLNKYALLIIDDLGIERRTEYMAEQIFNIIDARYRSGLPMIITTNLGMDELSKQQELAQTRIYDRILERCFPIQIKGESRRKQNGRESFFGTKERLGL